MWKHLQQPFGHRRSNSKRGKNRDRSARARANTINLDDTNPSGRTELSKNRTPTNSSPPRGIPPGPSTNRLMTTATMNDPRQGHVPPTKASLRTWWNHFAFAQRAKREAEEKKGACGESFMSGLADVVYADAPPPAVFGRPLSESLRYASVQISTANSNGELYVWGFIPVVVAKWCVRTSLPVVHIPGN